MRTTIYLDEELNTRVRRFVAERGLSRFIGEAVAEKVAVLEAQELEKQLIEGYIATREDREELNADWGVLDVEGWPEWE